MRGSRLLAVACSLLFAGCLGAPTTTPIACGEAGACGEGERCVSNRCVAGDEADAGARDASDIRDLAEHDARDSASSEPDVDVNRDDADAQLVPCDGACGDDLVCDLETGKCVDCLVTQDCESGVCDPARNTCVECVAGEGCADGVCDLNSNTCVGCLENTDCIEATASVCDLAANTCVGCLTNEDCADGVCDPTTDTCVGCLGNTDCTDPAASVCDTATNACVGCGDSAECGHLTGTTVCDVSAATCVECLDDDATTRAPCGGNSCNPATNQCTQTPVLSVGNCEVCMADSECLTNSRCVPMVFEGTPRNNGQGGYCLQALSAGVCGAPYQTVIDRMSVNGAQAEQYCGITESLTTCEAVRDYIDEIGCFNSDDCGAANVADGRCDMGEGASKCTYRCTFNSECSPIDACGSNSNVCGGP